MYTSLLQRGLCVLLLWICALVPYRSLAQTPISPNAWTGQGTSAAGPSAFTSLPASLTPGVPAVAISQWNRDGSLGNTTAGGCYNSNGWLTGTGTLASAEAAGSDVYFTITNNAATELRVTELYLYTQVSATGPHDAELVCFIGSVATDFGHISTDPCACAREYSFTGSVCIPGGQTATFRLYAWNAGGGSGTMRINNNTYLTAVFANAVTATATNSSPVCEGTDIALTGTQAGGVAPYTYGWAGPAGYSAATAAATIIAPTTTAAGTYTFSATDALTCVATAPTVVTVNPMPTAIGGSLGVCAGSSSALTGTASGGTWSSGTTSVATIDAATGVLTGVTPGTSTITYTLAGGCYITSVATVSALPTAITGTFSICNETTTTLANATPGGTWSSSDITVSVGAGTGAVTGVNPGLATITYTTGSGCRATANMTINLAPEAIGGSFSICLGSTGTLTETIPSGVWSSGNTAVATVGAGTGVVTGVGTGTAIITYRLVSTGCLVTATVTINPLPVAITGASAVCPALTITLSDATAGGTWSSADATVSVASGTGTVTGITPGTANITYTLPTGCTATHLVTVNTPPPAISGTAVVCQGKTTTLSNTATGGTWASANTSVATVGLATGVVTGIAEGTTTITYTATTGCPAIETVTVNPIPAAISGALGICIGNSSTLGDADAGGTWSGSNDAIATVNSATGVVTSVSVGTMTVTYTLPTGCVNTATVSVNPLPAVIGGTKVVCAASTTTLGDASGTGTWTSSNTGIATVGIGNGVVTGVAAGTATITFTLPTSCFITAVVTVNPLPLPITGPSGICLGSSITLADAITPGTWTSSNTAVVTIGAATGIATSVTTGTAFVTYTISTGCNVRYAVTVNPLPVAIAGPASVCAAGGTITLTDASGGGTWSSSDATRATAGVITGIITGVAAGTANITYTLGTGCNTTTTITVNPVPGGNIVPVGDTTFCPGGFVLLQASSGVGYTYQWYRGGAGIAGATTSTYVTNATGIYQVRVYNTFGCSTLTVPMHITSDTPTATITVDGGGIPSTCAGTPLMLDANTGAGFAYQWLQGGSAIAGAAGASYTTSTSGDYAVVVTNATGCTATSATVAVTVNPLPGVVLTTTGALTFCDGGSATLSVPLAAGSTYQWNDMSGAIPGATNHTFIATATGIYWVEVENVFGCTATSAVSAINADPLPPATITPSGATVFCTGGNVTLTAPAGTYTYQWYKNGTLVPGATNSDYVATTTGDYTVRTTNSITGCTNAAGPDVAVTVINTPVITPLTPTAFCWGGSSLLSTSVSGVTSGIVYQWYRDGAAIPGANASTYNAGTAGTYKVDVTVTGSCAFSTSSVAVVQKPLPNPMVTFDGVNFHVQAYYVAYQWYKDAAAVAGATTSATPATGNGNYKVAVTDTNGCQSVSSVYVLSNFSGGSGSGTTTVSQAGGAEVVHIYPNPVQQELHIEATGKMQTTIYSADGRALLSTTERNMNIGTLAAGLYLVVVADEHGNKLLTEKLIKE